MADSQAAAFSPAAECALPPPSNGHPRPVPFRIGKYEVEAETGHTALGRVFRALDRDTGRPVSLHVLTEVAGRPLAERFRREVAIAANLRHANFIAIYELGEHLGLPFAAIEHLGGDTLRRAIDDRRPLTPLQKALIMWQVSEGLEAAHRGGLAYVGIRPSGIALGANAAIQDFGIVRLAEEEHELYASPEELASGFPPDSLCDIFSFGAIYYELLAGTCPVLRNSGPAPLRSLAPECPEALERLVHRALDQRRELRYQTLDELQDDAEPILRELKRGRAAVLLADARRLLAARELDPARCAIREALELDPDNRKAERLRRVLRALVHRGTVLPRLEALWRDAEEEAAARRFDRAVEILHSALRLDPAHLETRSRLDQVRSRLEESRQCGELLAEARQLFDGQALTEAHAKASAALARDPRHPDAAELLRAIGEAIERRERDARIERELARAKSLLLLQSFDEAILVLDALRGECPGSPAVEHWLAHVQAQKAAIAAAVRPLLQEVEWLLEQDRPDLAVQFLREKSAAFPGQPELASRLAAVEEMLPDWHKRRFIQDVLRRILALEQLQQWSVALTLVEESLASSPGAPELLDAAERLRSQLREQEGRKKLARIAAEVRQCLADGDTQQAEEVIRKGVECAGGDAVLGELRGELEAARKYRDGWHAAQVLFGRRQFQEAERLLVALAAPDRPEVDALLETVREARAASEERNFYDRGREKALKLIEDRQFEQAAGLLVNLLSLFPADPILKRDLQTARSGDGHAVPLAAPDEAPPEPSRAAESPAAPMVRADPPRRARWLLIAMAAVALLVSGSVLAWMLSRSGSAAPPAASAPAPASAPARVLPGAAPPPESHIAAARPAPSPAKAARAAPPRPFSLSALPANVPGQSQAPLAAPPLVTASGSQAPALAATVAKPAAPPPPPPSQAPKPMQEAAAPPLPRGGNLREAKCVRCPPPAMPPIARQLAIRGVVMLEAVVDRTGAVTNVAVLNGHPVLAQAAKSAVAAWRYEPATLNGQPIARKTFLRVLFEAGQ